MTNLYEKTVENLNRNGKSIEDVVWVGTKNYKIDLESFWELAKETMYDSGFGGQEIALDLLVVGKDFWLERVEYDGSERWEFQAHPEIPETKKRNKKINER